MTLPEAIAEVTRRANSINGVSMRKTSLLRMADMLGRWLAVEGHEARKAEAIHAALGV